MNTEECRWRQVDEWEAEDGCRIKDVLCGYYLDGSNCLSLVLDGQCPRVDTMREDKRPDETVWFSCAGCGKEYTGRKHGWKVAGWRAEEDPYRRYCPACDERGAVAKGDARESRVRTGKMGG